MKMIKSLLNKNKVDLLPLIQSLKTIREKSEILNIAASPTEYSWLGVFNAAKSLFPSNTFELPQYYSTRKLNKKELKIISQNILELGFKQVIFNGFSLYFSEIIDYLKDKNKNISIGLIHHGFLAELAQNEVQQKAWQTIINLSLEKKIDKIGFVKANMPEYFENAFGIKSYLIYNKNPTLDALPKKLDGLNIGVLINHTFRKNIYNQVAAALLFKDSKVYVGNKKGLECLGNSERIIEVGHLEHSKFLELQAKMQLNFHVTFSEASGGQGLTESLAVGTPCLSSLTHGYLDFDKELRKALIVDKYEDPFAIFLKAKSVLENYENIRNMGLDYSKKMNNLVEKNLKEFLKA